MDLERWLWVIGCTLFWIAMIALMYKGWRGRARRQTEQIGELPAVPESLGEPIVRGVTGLYVGSTLAPSWQDRVVVADLGERANGELTRFATGILLDRDGAMPIWIPQDAIIAVRTERGLAGKVMTKDGVLVVRWALPNGTELDTGFRADDKSVYPDWTAPLATTTPDAPQATEPGASASTTNDSSNGEHA
ncbi:transporter [Rhodococcus rhodnii]|uniref:PH domain-containing protein n=2 Tax=Rhodococcus rhodnii TaxID=38312 RepID=R7WPL0_9NOCA|nr:hypothetical protein [Rhodococcus rhodnii]EOM75924.1 hypothetical protein Rrhod_2836 [Rhodococcus rhodnii LMG 5362]TXG91084.1 transporter [Rhodococcus rhodnii]